MPSAEFPAQQALHALYSNHHGWLFKWLRRRLGDTADAADLAHDTFLRLLVKPAARELDNLAETRVYLRTVANGLCVDLWRRRQVEQAWSDTLAVLRTDYEPSPEQRAIVIETLMQIACALSRLPEKAALAFVMAQIDGVRYRDIADELGVSERMVKKYVAQGMFRCALAAGDRPD